MADHISRQVMEAAADKIRQAIPGVPVYVEPIDGKTKIVWREWFNEAAVASLTKMGTLPRNESMIDTRWMDGEEIAAEIAKEANDQDGESFREGGEIVIVEPAEFAGTYDLSVE